MIKLKVFFLCIFTICIFTKIYSSDISEGAKYIFHNTVEISRIDSFLYHRAHELDSNRMYVARSLLKYTNEEAINLFTKMLKDNRSEYQNFSIFPLINAGKFDIAFTKYKELILNNKINIFINFYHRGDDSDFSKRKLSLYKKHKDEFTPFLKKICMMDTISYQIRLKAAVVLYYIGEKKELKFICEEIVEKVPKTTKNWKDHSPEESKNENLRYEAKQKLKNLNWEE